MQHEDPVALFTKEVPLDNITQTIQDAQFPSKDILYHLTICNNIIINAPTGGNPVLLS